MRRLEFARRSLHLIISDDLGYIFIAAKLVRRIELLKGY